MEFIKDGVKFAASLLIVMAAWIGYSYLMYQSGYNQAKREVQPVILYTVDNAGGVMVGEITDKEIIEGRYTVTAHAYGKFLVTKEQYGAIKVGDPIPDYLKKRGN
ncbi:DUF1372 family protein [Streptococcus pseudoporcinus]|uniref:Phage protein n=1 Tax=Streptococcus pseudoporcinus TaxID=361101 RepID=A0A4U9XJK1_9STRE|nr:DUF1372 family protein [Streptococcus pseudoporcinus]QBX28194.1 hypothetical protein Javan444_0032 [Streptococcus phage Javan444]VTS13196.1 phage protein [Streptococcus pseudoporcinus]VUC66408.1 phage protein [Streptococcus pseudoporcinus]VUC97336.1 phage protein [Streptococcus pseudoporcinus]VUC97725.1 phage protein [Streptococcus pseudoporcinus]